MWTDPLVPVLHIAVIEMAQFQTIGHLNKYQTKSKHYGMP